MVIGQWKGQSLLQVHGRDSHGYRSMDGTVVVIGPWKGQSRL
jgi:hypothetical protein